MLLENWLEMIKQATIQILMSGGVVVVGKDVIYNCCGAGMSLFFVFWRHKHWVAVADWNKSERSSWKNKNNQRRGP